MTRLDRSLLFTVSALYFGWGLSTREIIVVEAQDFGIAHDLFRSYGLTPDHSPLHFVFLNLWQRLDASSVAFLRLPSVVFCALAVVVVGSLATRIGGRVAGLSAAVLLATNPLVVDNARSLRMYGLAVLASASVLWLAHACIVVSRRRAHVVGLAAAVVLAVYNHLFAWLLVGSITLIFLFGRLALERTERRRLFKWAAIALVLLVPQVIHIFLAVGFTSERHAYYQGVSSVGASFLTEMSRTLFLGELAPWLPLGTYLLLAHLALLSLGIATLKRAGAGVVLALFLPAIGVSWALSLSNPVEPRYVNYLLPAIAVLMGLGVTSVVRARRWGWPVGGVVLVVSCLATHAEWDIPQTDWYAAVERIAAARRAGDVVAIFPGFWNAAIRRYGDLGETVPITFPVDLERVLAREQHVVLIALPGRQRGSIDALLDAHSQHELLFRTALRDPLEVHSIIPRPERPPQTHGQMLLAGVVGSGGYAWQRAADADDAFASVRELFADRSVIVGYEPYRPPWLARAFLGGTESELLQPNPGVASALAATGIKAAVLIGEDSEHVLEAARVPTLAEAVPAIATVAGTRVATLALMSPGSNAEEAIARARAAVGPGGRIVVFVRATADYGRLATARERATAHHLIDLGVDIVAGMGGWAAKEVETYENGVIAYSLGALLRPPKLVLGSQDSTSIALDLSFPPTGRTLVDVVPLTFDDRSRVRLGRADATAHITGDDALHLFSRIATARAFAESFDGTKHDLGAWQAEATTFASESDRALFAKTSSITAWFPLTPLSTPLRPFSGFFGGKNGYVALRGVLDLGAYRRALELDPAGCARVGVRFADAPLRNALLVDVGLPDDRLRSKAVALHEQTMTVSIDEHEVLAVPVPYRLGFHHFTIDTQGLPATTHAVTIAVRSNGTHFPVAIEATIAP